MCTMQNINGLKKNYDYAQENCYLIFHHVVKPRQIKKIKADWFDLNYGEKVLWLLVRELPKTNNDTPKYRRIKFKNIKPLVQVIEKGERLDD